MLVLVVTQLASSIVQISNDFQPEQSHELISNVSALYPNIPIIQLTVANITVPVLVDTGSSVSII